MLSWWGRRWRCPGRLRGGGGSRRLCRLRPLQDLDDLLEGQAVGFEHASCRTFCFADDRREDDGAVNLLARGLASGTSRQLNDPK